MEYDTEILKCNLSKRGFRFTQFETPSEALTYISELIPDGSSIGFGGSKTVSEIGLLPFLQNKNTYTLLHRDLFDAKNHEALFRKMHVADWYITSTNAISVSGDLINIDGRANRVAAMLNGPKNILVICGINKIVKSIDEGIQRVRDVASPLNCRRLNKKTPCAVTGKCAHCNSPDTICNATVIQHHPTIGSNVYIVLINKNLGF